MLRKAILANTQREGYHRQMFPPTLVPAIPGNGATPLFEKPVMVGQRVMPYQSKDGNDASNQFDRTFHPYDGVRRAGEENHGTSFFRRQMAGKRDMMPTQLGDLPFSANKLMSY
jgi:hypothetical protein